MDFSGGTNSLAVTTLRSSDVPGGLQRNEVAWMTNYTCRDAGLTQRWGWFRVGQVNDGTGLFQGKHEYDPVGAFPYWIWVVSGHVLRVDPDTAAVQDLSVMFGLFNSATSPFAYFVQAEEFLVIQSGDGVTLPLIWDGVTLRRSNGLTGVVGGTPGAVYTVDIGTYFTVPAVGNTVMVTLLANIPAGLVVGNVGTFGSFGTFEVTAAPPGNNLTIETVSSNVIGASIPPTNNVLFTVSPGATPSNINEIPAATAMVYYMYRIWYAQGRLVSAGDIVFGPSGTAAYGFRDSVLRVTENPLAVGGDGFMVPSQDGEIRGLQYGAVIDQAVGQGRLFIFTTKAVYSLQVPQSRAAWIAADSNNQPLMSVVQLVNGSVNDRSIVPVNGDLFYQSLEPGIRSLQQSVRDFNQWGNTQISANVDRILRFNDRSLMRASSGIFFDNRVLESVLPRQTPQGIVHDAIVPFDVMPASTFDQQRKPNWEGSWQAMPVLQLAVADFGGRERAFAAVLASNGAMELWELTDGSRMDLTQSDSAELANRIVSQVETPAFTWEQSIGQLELKKIVSGELWVDRLFGTVEFTVEFRPDGATCWLPWISWNVCTPRNRAESLGLPESYPVALSECYFQTMSLPKPPESCAPCSTGRPGYIVYQAQARITVKGFHRLRGFWMHAERVERALYPAKSMVC